MSVSISAGVRNALASLQDIANQSTVSKTRLATGKRVNTASDNAVNFFAAAGLNARADQFNGLMDDMSNAVQTITSASKGLDSIIKLVQQAQSTIKQVQADALTNQATKTGTALSTTAETALTGTSLKDVALNKVLNGASATTATATTAGTVGIGTAAFTSLYIKSGNSTYQAAISSTATVRDLVAEINKSGVARANVNDSGQLVITGSGSNTVQFGLAQGASQAAADTAAATATNANASFGFAGTDATTGIAAAGGNSAVRANLIQQFNDIRTQIDNLAKDAGFNGTNLLQGNKLSVIFNEKTGANQNKLDVQGAQISSANLGIQAAVNTTTAGSTNFQNDTEVSAAADSLTSALSSLRSTASNLGSSLSIVQTRQDFTKSMVDTLKNGADNLVNADQNQEAATLLALQTRQQLSQTSLSLSNQADQAILRLFG